MNMTQLFEFAIGIGRIESVRNNCQTLEHRIKIKKMLIDLKSQLTSEERQSLAYNQGFEIGYRQGIQ